MSVDLSAPSVRETFPDPELYRTFLGGKGMAGFFIHPHAAKSWDNPQIPLVLFTGPLTATLAPTSGRMTIASKSPLTGTIGDASVGGAFGTELKKAGFDGIIITGKAKRPTGMEITNGRVVFTDAARFTGRPVSHIHAGLKTKGASAATGPAAENGVRFAGVVIDGHYVAGRNGLGLVFSAKNLKYITVKGSKKPEVHDPDGLKSAREDILRLASASPVIMGEMGITNYGTAALYDLTSSRRMMPTDNFRKTFFSAAGRMNAHAYKMRYTPKNTGCRGCHIQCKKITPSGVVLPEFETMNHFSALIGNDDMDIVVRANAICNDAGMDTISAGATLACYAEINDLRLIGNEICTFLEDIALSRGIGAELKNGSYAYAQKAGRPESAMTVKKQELPAYDPRGAYGMALAYAVSTRGGCHLRAYTIGSEVLRKPVPIDRFTFSGKARIVKIAEDVNAAVDSLTACKFIFFGAALEEYAKAYSSVTGVLSSGQDLMKTGEKIVYRERIFNHLNGFTAADDDLPARFFNEPGSSDGLIVVRPLPRNDFLAARSAYYRIRGLDENGGPTKEKTKELGLEWNG
ncbi:MAG: aldehyde ferredoxin oxidoreductase C-terminal domain-containing protein [Desulfobacterales bacterium]